MLALVTRPAEDAEATATLLRQRGFQVMVEPMMTVISQPSALQNLVGVQGFLATSANGARALSQATARRDLPLWAVGDATARTARDLGFETVDSANGDVDSLAALVKAKVQPQAGRLLQAAGSDVAGDLSGQLTQAGYEVTRSVLYRTEAVMAFSPLAQTALAQGRVDVALFYSPRTAQIFTDLALAANIHTGLASTRALALSAAVARNLETLPWVKLVVAAHPNQDELFRALDQQGFPSD